jgi:hypothetical protein
MNYAFHPEAEREFIETAARYEAEIPGLGVRGYGQLDLKTLQITPLVMVHRNAY